MWHRNRKLELIQIQNFLFLWTHLFNQSSLIRFTILGSFWKVEILSVGLEWDLGIIDLKNNLSRWLLATVEDDIYSQMNWESCVREFSLEIFKPAPNLSNSLGQAGEPIIPFKVSVWKSKCDINRSIYYYFCFQKPI